MKSLIFHDLAKKELLDTRDFYDDLVFGLGRSFVTEVERSLNVIKIRPYAYPEIRDKIRKAVVIKFPYCIWYLIEKERIFILALSHQKRKPFYWVDRS